ncbi:LLM class flavin-dependent oxidoreductase [Amycolatopsis lurida]
MRVSLCLTGFTPVGPELVEVAESAGFDGVWLAEHAGFGDSVVPAAAGLARTGRIDVGVAGPGPAGRHPGVLAMELASLARLGPGRVRAQVGLGEPKLIGRLGGDHRGGARVMGEFVTALRTLLTGERLTGTHAGHRFDGFRLAHGPVRVPIDLLAVRPRMLETAARCADGVSLSAGASRDYLASTVRRVKALRQEDFRITAFALAAVADRVEDALSLVRPAFRGFTPEMTEVLAPGAELADRALIATPDTLGQALAAYADTGIDELALTLFSPLAGLSLPGR